MKKAAILLIVIFNLFAQSGSYHCSCYFGNVKITKEKGGAVSCNCELLGLLPSFKIKAKKYELKLFSDSLQKELFAFFIKETQNIDSEFHNALKQVRANFEKKRYEEYLVSVKKLKEIYGKLPDAEKEKIKQIAENIKTKVNNRHSSASANTNKEKLPLYFSEITIRGTVNLLKNNDSLKIVLYNAVTRETEAKTFTDKDGKFEFKVKYASVLPDSIGYYSLGIINTRKKVIKPIFAPIILTGNEVNVTVNKDSIVLQGKPILRDFAEFFNPIWKYALKVVKSDVYALLNAKKIERFYKKHLLSYASKNYDKPFVYFFLYSSKNYFPEEDLRAVYKNAESHNVKNFYYLEKIRNYLLPVKEIYEFSLQDTSGNYVNLSDFKGKYILLNFWASWCLPCVKEIPLLKKIHKEHPELVMIGISLDKNTNSWKQAVRKYKLTWINLLGNEIVLDKYKVEAIPTNILLTPEGKLIYLKQKDLKRTGEILEGKP